MSARYKMAEWSTVALRNRYTGGRYLKQPFDKETSNYTSLASIDKTSARRIIHVPQSFCIINEVTLVSIQLYNDLWKQIIAALNLAVGKVKGRNGQG